MLTINNDYDFVANKLIPKPDPNHPMNKFTTNMFAFSEAIWEPRVGFYLMSSISKLTVKEWGCILEAAAAYSKVIAHELKQQAKGKRKASSQLEAHRAEEEMELDYARSSDLETSQMG